MVTQRQKRDLPGDASDTQAGEDLDSEIQTWVEGSQVAQQFTHMVPTTSWFPTSSHT